MRIVPFVLILFILLFGAVAAVQTLNAPADDVVPTPIRPTVTPRPRPTSPAAEATPVAGAAATGPVLSTPASPATPAPGASAPTPTPGAQSLMKVGNTGGEGVFIRRTPNMNDKIRPWQDGTGMAVIGSPETVNGVSWLKVRAPDGAEGYIPAQYLVP